MKPSSARLFCLGLLFFGPAAAFAAPNDPNARELDRLLARVKPGQDEVAVGDQRFSPKALATMRDQQAGKAHLLPEGATESGIVLWPGGVVYYTFAGNVTALHQKAFLDAAAEWSAWANVTFVARTSQVNYVTVNDSGAGQNGGDAYVGMKGGQQTVNIGSTSWNRPTLAHEIGHTLGFVHEHQRSDRDSYVQIIPQNTTEYTAGAPYGPDFIKLTNSINKTAYDFESIMHYARNAFSVSSAAPTPGQLDPSVDTIEPLSGYIQYLDIMGQETDRVLSKLDRAAVAQLYGAPTAPTGLVVTNAQDSGPGTLRTAIYSAYDRSVDNVGSTNTVTFNIPKTDPSYNASTGVFTISPTWALVSPGDGTVIDGATQTAFTGNTNPTGPEIALNGASALASEYIYASGVRLRAANCAVKNLAIGGFNQYGVEITGAAATGNVVQGCFLGTTADGASAAANLYDGVRIYNGATGNAIGPANVISGNSAAGVEISGAGASGNSVTGNIIGLNAGGTAKLGNTFAGTYLDSGATSNTVGGTTAAARNVISGNAAQGVAIVYPGTSNNVVEGNYIGLNPAGNAALANANTGVSIYYGATSNTIGGSAEGAGNVISGNAAQGVTISNDSGDTGSNANTNSNTVAGNIIGLDATGSTAVANAQDGIAIFVDSGAYTAQANLIGGTAPFARNFIAGNTGSGVSISGAGALSNLMEGNTVGLNIAGAAVPNGSPQVSIYSAAQGNQIGGTVAGAGNLIVGNMSFGGLGIYNYDSPATTINNSALENSISTTGGTDIFLYNGANNSLAAPVISSAVLGVNTAVTGTLSGVAANGVYRLEFFATPSGTSGGKTFIGSTSVTANGSGAATFTSLALTPKAPAGYSIVATATNATSNTSMFSAARTVTTTDTDGDGMPDAYETAHGLNPNSAADASLDSDGDGMTNLQEFRAGTDPRDPKSRLQITTLSKSASDLTLTFNSVANQLYRVESTPDLSAPWRLFTDGIVGSGSAQAVSLTGVAGDPKRFFRLVAEP